MELKFIVIPLIGGLIGYLTNSLAITMLFRPHRAIYIGRWKLPFTPGLIAKEKDRLAKAVANMISDKLLNSQVLGSALLSDGFIERIEGFLDELVDRYRNSDKTLREELDALGRSAETNALAVTDMADQVSNLVADGFRDFQQGEAIAASALHELRGQYSQGGALRGVLARVVDDRMVDSVSRQLGGYIDRLVSQNGPGLIQDFITRQAENILDMPVSQVVARYEDQIPGIKRGILGAYRELVSSSLDRALRSFDLSGVIVDRINEFSTRELEQLVRSVIQKELNWIIWLGALLGFLIGSANLLFI